MIFPAKLDVIETGKIFGAVWGSFVFLLGFSVYLRNRDSRFIKVLSKVYFGFNGTLPGSLIGGGWGFLDGFLTGIVLAWIYNKV